MFVLKVRSWKTIEKCIAISLLRSIAVNFWDLMGFFITVMGPTWNEGSSVENLLMETIHP
jgi:hypothetical protein